MGYCPSTTQRSNVGKAEGDKWAATPLLFPNQLPAVAAAAAAAKSLQLYPTLCDPIDSSPPGSPSLGFSRQEHWSGLPFPSPMHESEKWKWSHSVISDSATPWTAAYQAPLSMGFSRQEYWSGLPLPSPTSFLTWSKSLNGVKARTVTVLLKLNSRSKALCEGRSSHFIMMKAAIHSTDNTVMNHWESNNKASTFVK